MDSYHAILLTAVPAGINKPSSRVGLVPLPAELVSATACCGAEVLPERWDSRCTCSASVVLACTYCTCCPNGRQDRDEAELLACETGAIDVAAAAGTASLLDCSLLVGLPLLLAFLAPTPALAPGSITRHPLSGVMSSIATHSDK